MMPHASLLKQFDDIQLGTLHRLFRGMDDLSDDQARLDVNAGGLGIRAAKDVALPAALASKIMAEPKVEFMLRQLRTAGLIKDSRLLERFRKGIDEAVVALCDYLKQRTDTSALDGDEGIVIGVVPLQESKAAEVIADVKEQVLRARAAAGP